MSDEQSVNRRRALAALGAGGAALGGLGVGSATAMPEPAPEADVSEYESVEAVELAVSEHADVLAELSSDGIVSEASVEEMGIQSLGKPSEEDDAIVAVSAQRTAEGVEPKVTVQRERDDGFLHLSVKPESGDSFAVWSAEDEEIELYGCDCDDGCECEVSCYTINNSSKCPNRSGYGYDVNYSCDCGW
jgi:hypothetical protein